MELATRGGSSRLDFRKNKETGWLYRNGRKKRAAWHEVLCKSLNKSLVRAVLSTQKKKTGVKKNRWCSRWSLFIFLPSPLVHLKKKKKKGEPYWLLRPNFRPDIFQGLFNEKNPLPAEFFSLFWSATFLWLLYNPLCLSAFLSFFIALPFLPLFIFLFSPFTSSPNFFFHHPRTSQLLFPVQLDFFFSLSLLFV